MNIFRPGYHRLVRLVAAVFLAGPGALSRPGALAGENARFGLVPIIREAADGVGTDSPAGETPEAGAVRRLHDPFEMRAGAVDDQGFVSAGLVSLPPGIRVRGILAVRGREPIGAVEIPGMPDIFFVRSGDVIQVDFPGDHGREAPGGRPAPAGQPLYLLVQSVTADEIVLAPRTRPQDTRIYR